jgi:hypothetical protein
MVVAPQNKIGVIANPIVKNNIFNLFLRYAPTYAAKKTTNNINAVIRVQ